MRKFPGIKTPLALALSALFILILSIGCVLESGEESGLGGGSTPGAGTPESTQTTTAAVEGTVESVDAEAGLLTLSTTSGESLVVSVDQSTAITINGSTGTLQDLQPGDSVELEVDQSTDIANSISVEGEEVEGEEAAGSSHQGTVENVDPESGLLILTTAQGESLVLSVEQSTAITINGSTATLEDLQAGDSVEVEVNQGTDVATSITAEGEKEAAETPEPGATENVQGTVESVDAETGMLTLTTAGGETLEVSVDQSTVIAINGSTGTLQDLQPGDSVELEVDQETKVATSVTLEGEGEAAETPQPGAIERVEGTVESVDAETGMLTLTTAGGETMEVSVDQSTAITLNGSTATLEDLQAGDAVAVEVNQETKVATSVTLEGEGEAAETLQQGTVESVDPESGEMAVSLASGDTITVNVDQSTAITINGSMATLEDIQPGDSVNVEVNQEANVATTVTIQSSQTTAVGEITKVDPLSQTLTVETQDNKVLNLRFLLLDGSTRVIIDGGEGSLPDLAQGTSVEITYNPETMVVSTVHVRTSVNSGAEGYNSP